MYIAPMCVQSYSTSVVPAIEIYLLEREKSGDGLAAFKKIIHRADANIGFIDALSLAGLSSPFKTGLLDDMMNEVYYNLTGIHFKTEENDINNAA